MDASKFTLESDPRRSLRLRRCACGCGREVLDRYLEAGFASAHLADPGVFKDYEGDLANFVAGTCGFFMARCFVGWLTGLVLLSRAEGL